MASLLSKTNLFSRLRGNPQGFQEHPAPFLRRGFHVELGAREKALLEEDPALKKFKSHKKSLGRVKKFGDALIILVVAGCSYEIYVKGVEKREKFNKVNETDST